MKRSTRGFLLLLGIGITIIVLAGAIAHGWLIVSLLAATNLVLYGVTLRRDGKGSIKTGVYKAIAGREER